jgi:hypothetical protein
MTNFQTPLPLGHVIHTDIFTNDAIEASAPLNELLQRILVINYNGDAPAFDPYEGFELGLAIPSEESFELPGFGGIEIVIGGANSAAFTVEATGDVDTGTFELTLEGSIRLRFPKEWFTPVKRDDDTWVEHPSKEHTEIEFNNGITIHQDGSVSFASGNSFTVAPAMIASSGFVIEGTVALDLSRNAKIDASEKLSPSGGQSIDPSWQGAVFTDNESGPTTLHFPEDMDVPVENIGLSDFHIGTGGITGTVSLEGDMPPPDSENATELFGMPYEITELDIQFVQTAVASCNIRANLKLPFFDDVVTVDLGVSINGDITATLSSTQDALKTVEKDNFTLKLDRIGFALEDEVPAVILGGTINPHPEDVDTSIPPIDVEELRVDANGNVDTAGGWIDLGDQYTADIEHATMELTKFGLGKTNGGRKWIGFNGGITITDGIPAGFSVTGLRFEFGGDRATSVSLEGIGIEFEKEDKVRFKGEVSLKQREGYNQFRGDVDLELPEADVTVDAEVVVGRTKRDGESFQYLGVFAEVEIPTGIPLWSTGLAIYGLSGLFAVKMEPDKTEEEKWYAIVEDESWYDNVEPPDVVPIGEQWKPAEGALAFGAGATLGSDADNANKVTFDLLLAMTFPGPIVTLQGKADMLNSGTDVPEDAKAQALAVLDTRADSLTFGVDAWCKEGDGGEILELGGSVEAFFDFSDPKGWYFNIGRRNPRDARVRGPAFSEFSAEAYLMLNAHRVAMGARFDREASWTAGPLWIGQEGWIAGHTTLNFEPSHFTGELKLHGKAGLEAFGTGVTVTVDADLMAEVFDPYHIKGTFGVSLSTPWPLPDPSASVTLEWGPDKSPPSTPQVVEDVAVGQQKLASTWEPEEGLDPLGPDKPDTLADTDEDSGSTTMPNADPASDAPVVPMDARPEVSFTRPVHDKSQLTANPHPPNPKSEVIGDPTTGEGPVEATYSLVQVRLLEYDNGTWTPVENISGSWAPMPSQSGHGQGSHGTDPDLNQTKLHLFARTPFAHSRHTGGAWEDSLSRDYPGYPCPAEIECYSFDNIGEPLQRSRSYSSTSDRTTFRYLPPGVTDWPEFQIVEDGDHSEPATLTPALSGNRRGTDSQHLRFMVPESIQSTENYPHEFLLRLPKTSRSARLSLGARGEVEGEVVNAGQEGGSTVSWSIDFNEQTTDVIFAGSTEGAASYLRIRFGFKNSDKHDTLRVQEICGTEADLAGLPSGTDAGVEQARNNLRSFHDRGRVLKPDTDYRLEVITKTDAKGQNDFDWYSETTHSANYYDFHTAGPPGLEAPDTPANGADNNPSGSASGKETSGLATLSRYVDQTTPPTIPAEGERPPLPRPVYRSDPVGVDFNVDYIDLAYRLARRDLTIHLYDDNDRPIRDEQGRLVLEESNWGPTPELLMDRATARWFATVGESECLDLDGMTVEATKRIERESDRRVLKANTIHEARIKPLLFRDRFDNGLDIWSGGSSWEIDEHNGYALGVLQVEDDTLHVSSGVADELQAGVDTVQVGEGDGAEVFGITAVDAASGPSGTGKIALGGELKRDATESWSVLPRAVAVQTGAASGGTRLRLTEPPVFDSDPGQPWTDYRVAVTLQTRRGGSGTVGLTIRDSGDTRYRLEMDTSKGRRLLRVEDNTDPVIWDIDGGCEPGRDYRVAVEAIGEKLTVTIDGEIVCTVSDPNGPDAGTVGLYARNNSDAQYDDVRIDDFRPNAPIAYRFSFTTSHFANARHHLHSFDDEVWSGTTPAEILSQAPTVKPGTVPETAEFRAFNAASPALPSTERDRLEVTLLHEGETPVGYYVDLSEPIDWATTDVTLERGPQFAVQPNRPDVLKLTDAIPGDADINTLVRETTNLNGWVVETRRPGTGLERTVIDERSVIDHLEGADFGRANWEFGDSSVRGQSSETAGLIADAEHTTVLTAEVRRESGKAGITFRYLRPTSFYGLIGDGDSLRLVHTKFSGSTVLWEGEGLLRPGQSRTLRVQLDYGRIRGWVDGTIAFDVADPGSGGLGKVGPLLERGHAVYNRFDVAANAAETVLGRWTFTDGNLSEWHIVDEPLFSTQSSDWQVEGGQLRQTSNIHGFIGGNVNPPGTYAVTGEDWSDYRLSTRLQSGDDGDIGILFRYRDDDTFYIFTMGNERKYRRLVRRTNGNAQLLWSDEESGYKSDRIYDVTIECVGDTLRGYIDGTQLFEVTDDAIDSGGIGYYARANEDATFYSLDVTAPAETWHPYHEFDESTPTPAGTVISLAETSPESTEMADAVHRRPSAERALSPRSVDIRVVDSDDEVRHMRQFRDVEYVNVDMEVLRSDDGTGLLIVDNDGLSKGAHRLVFSPHGQDSRFDRDVALDLPWDVQNDNS